MANENPSALKRAWRAWIRFGHWIGDIMSWVWMPVFYYVIAMPFALGMKLLSDPMGVGGGPRRSYWSPKQLPTLDLSWAADQGNTPVPHPAGQAGKGPA